MKVFIDANLIIYLNTLMGKERLPFHDFFKSLLEEELFMNALVIDEVLYVSKRRYGVPYELSLRLLNEVDHFGCVRVSEPPS